MLIDAGFRRFAPTRSRTAKRAARKLPRPVARKVIKRFKARTQKRIAKVAAPVQRNVKRLGTAKLMDYGALPWAEKQTRPLHPAGKGTGPLRSNRNTGTLRKTANTVSKGVKSLQNRMKPHEERLNQAQKAIKAGRLIYQGIGMTKFKGFLTPNGRVVKKLVHQGAKVLKRYDTVNKHVGNASRKLKTVSEYSSAIAKGELTQHLTNKVTQSVQAKAKTAATTKATAKATAAVGAKVALKTGGRFVPGANIVVAGLDIKNAFKTVKDPKASSYKKAMAVTTAVFSAVSSSNVPGLSQIAAGVSTLTSLAGSLEPKKAGKAIKNFFSGL